MFLGVDPGLSGALALYDPVTDFLRVEDIPTFMLTRNGKNKREIDVQGLVGIVGEMSVSLPTVWIENSTPMPEQGAASVFAFGKAFGILLGVLGAHRLVVERIAPVKWKRALAVPRDKDGARARASVLLPRHSGTWKRVKDDGRAEASLIAYYGARVGGFSTAQAAPQLEDLF
jgi:crossover junction endodeoxyribonuclease RuvC